MTVRQKETGCFTVRAVVFAIKSDPIVATITLELNCRHSWRNASDLSRSLDSHRALVFCPLSRDPIRFGLVQEQGNSKSREQK